MWTIELTYWLWIYVAVTACYEMNVRIIKWLGLTENEWDERDAFFHQGIYDQFIRNEKNVGGYVKFKGRWVVDRPNDKRRRRPSRKANYG